MDGGTCSSVTRLGKHSIFTWAVLAILISAFSLTGPAFAGSVMGTPETHTTFELGPVTATTDIIGDGLAGNGPDWADIIDCSCVTVPCGATSGRTCALRDSDGDGTPDASEVWGGIG